jgi:hypothetical protein
LQNWAIDGEFTWFTGGFGVKCEETGERIVFADPKLRGQPHLSEFPAWFDKTKQDAMFESINGHAYDLPMMQTVMAGEFDHMNLKKLSDQIFNDPDDWKWRRTNVSGELHVDLLALHGGKEQCSGSKELAIKFNLPSVRESPVDFNAPTATEAEIEDFWHTYNGMDLDTILAVLRASKREIDMRIALYLEYGCNVISLPDAGVADKLMAHQLYPNSRVPKPTINSWRLPLAPLCRKVSYQHPNLIALQDRLSQMTLEFNRIETVEKGRTKLKIDGTRLSESVLIGDKHGKLAKGGFHTEDAPGFYVADADHRLLECDFKSFYPMLILAHQICPEHIPRHPFLATLKKLVDKRLAERDTNPVLSNGMKIATNSVFGKTGSPYSGWCDPAALHAVTILGELTLLMLIDLLLTVEDHVQLISANTDAVLFRVTTHAADAVIEACDAFAKLQGQSLGWTVFSRVVKRDVNSYLAFDLDGKVIRAKGAYQYDADRVRGKACNRVVIDAVQNFFRDDTPLADTILGCRDVRRFVDYRKTQRTHVIADDRGNTLGSVQRWVIVTGAGGVHLDSMRRADGQRTQIVECGALLVPDLPEVLPTDIDYQHYIDMAQALVLAITDPPTRADHVIPLAELSKAQRAQHTANANTTEVDLEKCAGIDMGKLRDDYAAIYKGNQRDTMKACLLRLWWREAGGLTQGDLLHCARELDASTGYFSGSRARNLEQMCEWIAQDISPFPIPRTTEEYAARALVWAQEHVEPLKRKRAKVHRNAVTSDFINGEALRRYGKLRDQYKLACHISAVSVKHAANLSVADVAMIIEDVKTYFKGNIDEAVR